MSKVKCQISISADGYLAGPNQSEELGLGEGGEALHEWAFKTELLVHQVPVILGGGVRLLDGIPPSVKLEQTRVVEAPGVAHIFYALSY